MEILKALYRDARILILDEPTAVLTPQETEALFATLRKLTATGLSIIFISPQAQRGAGGGRPGAGAARRQAGRRAADEGHQPPGAGRADGRRRRWRRRASRRGRRGRRRWRWRACRRRDAARAWRFATSSLTLRAGEIIGIAGVSGNGQAALAGVISGMETPTAGDVRVAGQAMRGWSPRAAIAAGIGRIPEDRHAVGSIADMSVTENVISERYRSAPLQPVGSARLGRRARFRARR